MAIGKKLSNIRNLVTAILILIGFIAICPLSNRVYNAVKTEDVSNYNTDDNAVLKNFQVLVFTSPDKVEALSLSFVKDIKQQKELAVR